jgi:hypothetical protein
MLYYNRNIRLYDAGIVGIARDRLGIGKVVETHMFRAPRRNRYLIRSDRITVAKVDCDLNVCILIRDV